MVMLTGFLGAVLGALVAAVMMSRKERNILIEKWMNNLRDEISKFLGVADELYFTGNSNNTLNIEMYSSRYRVMLLLDKDKTDQKILVDNVLLLSTHAIDGKTRVTEIVYIEVQKFVFEQTRDILSKHWHRISYQLKYPFIGPICERLRENVANSAK